MVQTEIAVPAEQLAEFCRRHRIRRLSLFGSVLRDDFGPESDVDVLVDFEPGADGWRAVEAAREELSALLGGREVDLIRRRSLNRWVRARVFAEEEVLYDRETAENAHERRFTKRPRTPAMTERDTLYFGHMLDAAREAIEIASGVDEARFNADRVLRLALTRLVQNVGEAARKVSPEGRAAHPDVPWQAIVGMRHVLVHDYDRVDEPMVWETVIDDLPVLVVAIEGFLDEPTERPAR